MDKDSVMSMPRFTADASLYTSSRTYQWAGSPTRSGGIIQSAIHVPLNYLSWDYVYNLCIAECWPDLICLQWCLDVRFKR